MEAVIIELWASPFLWKQKLLLKEFFFAYGLQKYGEAERKKCTALSTARALLNQKPDLKEFYTDAVSTAIYVLNMTTYARTAANKTPFQKRTKKMPSLGLLQTFGSSCWYQTRKALSKNLENSGSLVLLAGYASRQKRPKLWDDEN